MVGIRDGMIPESELALFPGGRNRNRNLTTVSGIGIGIGIECAGIVPSLVGIALYKNVVIGHLYVQQMSL